MGKTNRKSCPLPQISASHWKLLLPASAGLRDERPFWHGALRTIRCEQKFSPVNNRHTRKTSFPPTSVRKRGKWENCQAGMQLHTNSLPRIYIYKYTLNILFTTWWWKFEILQSIPKISCLIHVVMCGGNPLFCWQCVPVRALKANLICLLASSISISADAGSLTTISWLGWGMARRIH